VILPDPLSKRIIDIERDFQDNKQFAEECLYIRDKSGKRIRYKFAPCPAKLWAAVQYQRERGLPVRILLLKARQVYGSTWVAAFFVQMCGFLAVTALRALLARHSPFTRADTVVIALVVFVLTVCAVTGFLMGGFSR
jgi:hypothetical protein